MSITAAVATAMRMLASASIGERFFVAESLDLQETLGDESILLVPHPFPAFSNFTAVLSLGV